MLPALEKRIDRMKIMEACRGDSDSDACQCQSRTKHSHHFAHADKADVHKAPKIIWPG